MAASPTICPTTAWKTSPAATVIESIAARNGDGCAGLAQGVTRLTDLMWMRARQSAVLNVDETYVKELAGEGRTLTGYLWVGVGDARHPYDCFTYTSSRAAAGRNNFCVDFRGIWSPTRPSPTNIRQALAGSVEGRVLNPHARRGLKAAPQAGARHR
ncbi:MAG: transposase [Pirellulales bacterium]